MRTYLVVARGIIVSTLPPGVSHWSGLDGDVVSRIERELDIR